MVSTQSIGSDEVPILGDGVVTLRAHRPDDTDRIIAHARDPQMQRWTQVPVPYGRRDAEQFLATAAANWATGRAFSFAIHAEDGFAGSMDLRPLGDGAAEIGYALAPWARGRRVMSRALRICLRWGFEDRGLEVVQWRAQVGNWPSRRVAWACGFRVEGTVRGLLAHRSRREDGWIGTLRREDPMTPAHAWFDPPVLTDGPLALRPHQISDLPDIVEACQDVETQRWLDIPHPYSEEDAVRHLTRVREQQASGRGLYWIVADAGSSQLKGEIGLFVRDDSGRHGEVGYWAHPRSRRRGAISSATRLVVRHALLPRDVGGLGMDRVLLRAAAANHASQRVAERVGFVRAGLDRNAGRARDGTLHHDIRFDLLPDDLPVAPDDLRTADGP